MEVDIVELKAVAEKLFTRLQASGCQVASIPHDYYWSIPKETRYDPYSQPGELTLGQLSDVLTELRRIASGEAEALACALVWLAAIIRAVGEETIA